MRYVEVQNERVKTCYEIRPKSVSCKNNRQGQQIASKGHCRTFPKIEFFKQVGEEINRPSRTVIINEKKQHLSDILDYRVI